MGWAWLDVLRAPNDCQMGRQGVPRGQGCGKIRREMVPDGSAYFINLDLHYGFSSLHLSEGWVRLMGIISQPRGDAFNSLVPAALQRSAFVTRLSQRCPTPLLQPTAAFPRLIHWILLSQTTSSCLAAKQCQGNVVSCFSSLSPSPAQGAARLSVLLSIPALGCSGAPAKPSWQQQITSLFFFQLRGGCTPRKSREVLEKESLKGFFPSWVRCSQPRSVRAGSAASRWLLRGAARTGAAASGGAWRFGEFLRDFGCSLEFLGVL